MDVFVLRIRSGKKKKDYRFTNVSDAAIFESVFRSREDSKNIEAEILYKNIIYDNIKESKCLLQEMSKNPTTYAEKEYVKWFHPEEIIYNPGD